jgi:PAS domain S-box-containing protein
MRDAADHARVDLTACDREPIHAPGAVQPHASFLALDHATGEPVAASQSLAVLTGRPVADLLGPEGLTVFDAAARETLRALLRNPAEGGPAHLRLETGESLAAHAYAADGLLMVDLEPCPETDWVDEALCSADRAMRALRAAPDEDALYEAMVDAIGGITGFDRVMLYRFDPDWNGEVIAETRSKAAPASFKGLKFPASDIPRQARALFLRNRVRQIVEVGFGTSPIEPPMNPLTGAPYDLSDSQVRAVSPVHVEYMMNMGVRASLVIALMREGALWGLIACHHYQGPRSVPPRLRSVCSLLCEAFSAELGQRLTAAHAERLSRYAESLAALSHEAEAAARAGGGIGFNQFIASRSGVLLDPLGAEGVVAWVGGEELAIGATLPREEAVNLVLQARQLAPRERGGVVSADTIGAEPGPRVAAGFAYAPVGAGSDGVLAFRRETVIPEFWAGDPEKRVSAPDDVGRLHPRRSFDLYRSERRGHCLPWSEADRGILRIIAEHVAHWRLSFEQARRDALIRRIENGRRELRRLALVAERANDSVVMTDAAGTITWVNAAFTALTGYVFDEVRGRRPGAVLQGPETDSDSVARLRTAIAARQPVRETLVNYRKDGTPYWIELEIAPVFDESGEPDLFVSIQRDVTEARQREAALAKALDRAQGSDRLKDEFLRTLSHEVRTPLNGVLGGVALLTSRLTDEKDRQLAHQVQESGRALLDLFSEMLEIARVEAQSEGTHVEPVEPRRLLDSAAATVAPEALGKGLDLIIEPCTPGETVPLDARRLRQILTNFVANAVKFTPAGRVSLRTLSKAGGRVHRFEVEDDGPGVPPEMRERIFQPFVQLDAGMERRFGGAGLGLAICRKLAHEMGGSVGVGDGEGGGALFWVEVPVAP